MDDKNLSEKDQPEKAKKGLIGDNEDYIFQHSDIKPHSERWL